MLAHNFEGTGRHKQTGERAHPRSGTGSVTTFKAPGYSLVANWAHQGNEPAALANLFGAKIYSVSLRAAFPGTGHSRQLGEQRHGWIGSAEACYCSESSHGSFLVLVRSRRLHLPRHTRCNALSLASLHHALPDGVVEVQLQRGAAWDYRILLPCSWSALSRAVVCRVHKRSCWRRRLNDPRLGRRRGWPRAGRGWRGAAGVLPHSGWAIWHRGW